MSFGAAPILLELLQNSSFMIDVDHVAKLARLGLTEKEKKQLAKELSSILEFVEKLKKADTSKIEPMAHAVGIENVMRPDRQRTENLAYRQAGREQRTRILKLAPKRKGKYVKVKAVL